MDSCTVRWVAYADSITGKTMLGACLPAYDRTRSPPTLLGVSCMDMNMFIKYSNLTSHIGHPSFKAQYEAETKTCPTIKMDECMR